MFFLLLLIHSGNAALDLSSCLSIQGACDLRLDEVTLPGAHNAGSGFDDILYYHNAGPDLPAISCYYRNQGVDVYNLLKRGVRYLDVDLCYEDDPEDYDGESIWTCHAGAYGGRMSKFLQQVDKWINEEENRNEVVVIHFNRDHEKGEYQEELGDGIKKMLEDLWGPSKAGVKMQSYLDAKLRQSVASNKRIYIFLHTDLQKHIPRSQRKPYFFSQNYVGYTWRDETFFGLACKKFANFLAGNCPKEANRKFVRLDFYYSRGFSHTDECNDDLAEECNKVLKDAVQMCYDNIQNAGKTRKTVNFLAIDYADTATGQKQVAIAKALTEKRLRSRKRPLPPG